MKLSENFTLEEMVASATAKNRKIDNIPGPKEIEKLRELCCKILQPIRDKFGKPIRVSSGYRCSALNKAVGGVITSQHIKGEAADIICEDKKKLWDLIIGMIKAGEIEVGQLIDEKGLSWIHISLPNSNNRNRILFGNRNVSALLGAEVS